MNPAESSCLRSVRCVPDGQHHFAQQGGVPEGILPEKVPEVGGRGALPGLTCNSATLRSWEPTRPGPPDGKYETRRVPGPC